MEDFQHLRSVDSSDACQGRGRQNKGRKNDVEKGVFEDPPVSADQTINKEETGDGGWRIDDRIEPSSKRKQMKFCSQKELSMIPNQNMGMATPVTEKKRALWSIHVSL